MKNLRFGTFTDEKLQEVWSLLSKCANNWKITVLHLLRHYFGLQLTMSHTYISKVLSIHFSIFFSMNGLSFASWYDVILNSSSEKWCVVDTMLCKYVHNKPKPRCFLMISVLISNLNIVKIHLQYDFQVVIEVRIPCRIVFNMLYCYYNNLINLNLMF